jgi:hypothetical protein
MTAPLEFHQLANIFPMMTDAEVNDLGDDMLEHGQREPIWRFQGMILDGRNRYNACLLKGIEPHFEDFRGADPLAFVMSLNLHRRHLDESQRGMVMARIAKLPKGANQHSAIALSSIPTQAEAATMLNVSVDTGKRARVVLEQGIDELINAVDQGSVSVSAAAQFAKQPKEDQAKQIAEAPTPADAVKASKLAAVKIQADRAEATSAAAKALSSDPIEEPCDDCNTEPFGPEERWQRSLGNMAGDAISLPSYWTREFGDWEKFEVPTSLVTLVKQAAKVWAKLEADLASDDPLALPEFLKRTAS